MYSHTKTVIASVFIIFFVHKSFHCVNSQSISYNVDVFNNTETNALLDSNESAVKDTFNNCSEAFELFTEKITNLTRCTLLNARPIRICMDCEEQMMATNESYKNLLKENLCKQFYFESDEVGVINIIYDQVLSLWSRNNCHNCYKQVKQTEEFFKLSRDFENCLKLYNGTEAEVNSTCHMCLELYIKMNDIYKKFVKNISNDDTGICMDIIDQMNITRHTWSNLQCLKFDSYIGFPIIITSVIVGIIPVLFYLLSKNVSIIEDVKLVRPKRKSYASLQDSLPKE